ncbi:hypothetical protein Q8W71_17235 [Methylobacterium sp. NEAU 140]|uniref:hypothetical protein n=1 Tax=Methylobacterium sp. NEAU 140 TaxID=3064945 RepID=UPI002734798A|nr:hypothetical protein [Methylobacterium sp. NEAU 140]MDP4024373.1 hypothetical protein [Methylobacterium sp. NEAU 140]
MKRAALILSCLALVPLGGCLGARGPGAGSPQARVVAVPVAPASGGPASTLILGVQ